MRMLIQYTKLVSNIHVVKLHVKLYREYKKTTTFLILKGLLKIWGCFSTPKHPVVYGLEFPTSSLIHLLPSLLAKFLPPRLVRVGWLLAEARSRGGGGGGGGKDMGPPWG